MTSDTAFEINTDRKVEESCSRTAELTVENVVNNSMQSYDCSIVGGRLQNLGHRISDVRSVSIYAGEVL
jgi:hypothetical protein